MSPAGPLNQDLQVSGSSLWKFKELPRCCEMNCCCCLVTKLCPTLLLPHGLQPASLLCSWDFPGKNTGVSCHFLLQELFLTWGSNPLLLHWQAGFFLPLSHQGALMEWITSPQRSMCWNLHLLPSVIVYRDGASGWEWGLDEGMRVRPSWWD